MKGRGSSIHAKNDYAALFLSPRSPVSNGMASGFQSNQWNSRLFPGATVFGLGLTQSNQADDISLQSCWGRGGGGIPVEKKLNCHFSLCCRVLFSDTSVFSPRK